MELGLKDRIAFIPGSSRGIGLAIAKGMLAEGSKVILNSRNNEELSDIAKYLLMEYPDRLDWIAGDMLSSEDVERVALYISQRYGKIDIFVGNLGSGKAQSKNQLDAEELKRFYEINVVGNMNILSRLQPKLKCGTNPSVTLISSVVASEVSQAPCGYAAAKSAVITLTRYLSRLWAEYGIRVNCVMPGNVFFTGGRWDELLSSDENGIRSYIDSVVPMKRFGKPEEIADAVMFISSDRASFITGAVLTVDGGQASAI